MRGMLKQLITRIYFPDDPANADDAVLQSVPAERRDTLIAQPVAGQAGALKWDVRLQGEGETSFSSIECASRCEPIMHLRRTVRRHRPLTTASTVRRGAPVLVLSNSLGTDLAMWEPQIAALTRAHRVLRYDTRGHGQSAVTPGPYTIEQLGRDVVALLDHLAHRARDVLRACRSAA